MVDREYDELERVVDVDEGEGESDWLLGEGESDWGTEVESEDKVDRPLQQEEFRILILIQKLQYLDSLSTGPHLKQIINIIDNYTVRRARKKKRK